MKKRFLPTLFLLRGNEKQLSLEKRHELISSLTDAPFEIIYSDKGKPYIKSDEPIGLSISHSGGVVAFLITPFENIGIDIEKIKCSYPLRVPDRYFSESEKSLIKSPSDFFKLWCKKESLVKLTGEGLSGIKNSHFPEKKYFSLDLSKEISEKTGEEFAGFLSSEFEFVPQIILKEDAEIV